MTTADSAKVLQSVVQIVSAYVRRNSVSASEIEPLINMVRSSLVGLGNEPAAPISAEPLRPAVPVKRSVFDDYIICLEDGKKFKSLKRHLRSRYNLTPEQYRAKWKLAADYPMVAPAYAATRSQMAKDMGLGQKKS